MLKRVCYGEKSNTPCALMLGGFDGFHKGHLSLLNAAKKTGLPVAVTAIAGGKAGGDIFTLAERELIFEKSGVDFALELSFTEELKRTPAEKFLTEVFQNLPVKHCFCGEDFRFGKNAAGDFRLLKTLAPCSVSVLPAVKNNGQKISASQIKACLKEGKMQSANALLCEDYFILGAVEHGREVGRTLGFPTLNLSFPKEKFPLREGVYGGVVATQKGTYSAVINFGARPTFQVEEKKIEAYLEGFTGDLYGERVQVYPKKFLRPIQNFKTKQALIEQLQKDKEYCEDVR